jgi:hypothetical protein
MNALFFSASKKRTPGGTTKGASHSVPPALPNRPLTSAPPLPVRPPASAPPLTITSLQSKDGDEENDSEQEENNEVEEINDDDFIEVIEEVAEKTESGEVQGDEDSRSPRQQKRQVFFLQVRVRYGTLVVVCHMIPAW